MVLIPSSYIFRELAPLYGLMLFILLINCLNIIFVLSQDEDGSHISQEIIRTLSDHLRYTLANQTQVSLYTEMFHVKNYLHLIFKKSKEAWN